jgi:rubrerythrin
MDRPDATQPSALAEVARDDVSRKRFLRMAGGAAAAAGLSAAIAACGDDEQLGNEFGGAGVGTEQYGQGDAGIVSYALALERLEVAFYRAAVESGKLSGRALEHAKRFGEAEAAHVKTLEGTLESLGGSEPEPPKFSFVLEQQEEILITAAQIENVGAGAYLGQARRIQSKQILAAALSIQSVEARHAAALALLLGRPITPDGAFAAPVTSADALRQIRPFIAAP